MTAETAAARQGYAIPFSTPLTPSETERPTSVATTTTMRKIMIRLKEAFAAVLLPEVSCFAKVRFSNTQALYVLLLWRAFEQHRNFIGVNGMPCGRVLQKIRQSVFWL